MGWAAEKASQSCLENGDQTVWKRSGAGHLTLSDLEDRWPFSGARMTNRQRREGVSCIGLDLVGQVSDLGVGLRASDRWDQQATAAGWLCWSINFSLAIGRVSRKVCIGVLP